MKKSGIILFCLSVVFASCGNYDLNKESISSGTLKIGVDESYSLMMESEIDVFEKVYEHAKVTPTYEPEADVINDLLNDTIQAAIINRTLTDQEMEMFKSKQRFPEVVRIAVDGVALIINPANADTVLTMDQLSSIITGSTTNWNQVTTSGNEGEIKVVFDNNKSCNARYMKEKFLNGQGFPAGCFAVNSNEEVIRFVNENKNAIGIISVSWISDREDSTSQSFMSKVKVMGLIDPANQIKPEMARKPYQAYIFDKSYPLIRDVFAIRSGLKGTLGTGFVSYLAGEKGQLIIHKMGMVAATSPVRTIKITK